MGEPNRVGVTGRETEAGPRDKDAAYASPPQRRIWFYVAGGFGILLLAGLASAIWGIFGLYSVSHERQAATSAFLEVATGEGLPAIDDPIYHSEFAITEDALRDYNLFLTQFGEPTWVGKPQCGAVARLGTQQGMQANCVTDAFYEAVNGRFEVVWKTEMDDWRLFHFAANFEDSGKRRRKDVLKVEPPSAADLLQ